MNIKSYVNLKLGYKKYLKCISELLKPTFIHYISILKLKLSTCIEMASTADLYIPGIRPNASGAATVSPDGKQVGMNFITNLIIIIKICYLLYIL